MASSPQAQDAAGRIVRRVQDQQPRLRRDLRFELRRVEREVARSRKYSGTGTAPLAWICDS